MDDGLKRVLDDLVKELKEKHQNMQAPDSIVLLREKANEIESKYGFPNTEVFRYLLESLAKE